MDSPDTQSTQQRRIHPLVATAAGAVIIASLVATAAVTGLFPKASSNGAQADQTQAAQVATQPNVIDSAAPANLPAQQSAQQAAPQNAQQAAPQQAEQQPQRAPAPAPAQQQYAQQQQAQPAPQ